MTGLVVMLAPACAIAAYAVSDALGWDRAAKALFVVAVIVVVVASPIWLLP